MRPDRTRTTRAEAGGRAPRLAGGFTLIELLVVVAIIGLLVAFVVSAATDGVRRAEERATQGLIAKLDSGLSDRLEALLQQRAEANQTHLNMAAVNLNIANPAQYVVQQYTQAQKRAQVIAEFDNMKAELPDVFYVQDFTGTSTGYPINFAGLPFPLAAGSPVNYVLPLGNSVPTTLGGAGQLNGGKGIYGAAYTTAAGIYKNLGYLPQGYNGSDDNGNGLIDEWAEGIGTNPQQQDPTDPTGVRMISLSQLIQNRLAAHTHKTARSEMLYAILVEGRGPLGTVFSRDQFTDREVQDTDGDGLPEFVDAWGEPLQFYRWPIFFQSDLQKGASPYNTVIERREQDPLDPNQQLIAPSWWSSYNATNSYLGNSSSFMSTAAMMFQSYFHLLVDPNYPNYSGALPSPFLWDRGSLYPQRRAFYSKFLILSGGLDKTAGVPRLDLTYQVNLDPFGNLNGTAYEKTATIFTGNPLTDVPLLMAESEASPTDPSGGNASFFNVPSSTSTSDNVTKLLQNVFAPDDITNHNLQAPGGGIQ